MIKERIPLLTTLCISLSLVLAMPLFVEQPVAASGLLATSTVVLQEGLRGYRGTSDAYIDRWFPNTNFPGGNWLMVTESDTRSSLISFDLSDQLPQGATVVTATLEVYAYERAKALDERVDVYRVRRHWLGREVTWNRASSGQYWGSAGCGDTTTDRDPVALDSVVVSAVEQWYRFDVTSAVQQWVYAPNTNRGVLLKGVDEGQPAEYTFLGSESGQDCCRPVLRIEYTVGPTPTPPTASLRFNPRNSSVASDSGSFDVDVVVDTASSLGGFELNVTFNASVVRVDYIVLGTFLTESGRTFTPLGPQMDNNLGLATFGAFSYGPQPGPSGSGPIARITFSALGSGGSALRLPVALLTDPTGALIPVTVEDGSITVEGGLIGDVDGDCDVDIVDVMLVASRWGASSGSPNYDPRYDLDNDADIDIADIMIVAANFGQRCGSGAGPLADVRAKDRSVLHKAVSAQIRVVPEVSQVPIGDVLVVEIVADNVADLGGFEFTLGFSPQILQVDEVQLGEFLSSTGRFASPLGPVVDNSAGGVTFGAFSYGQPPGPSGSGTLAYLSLRAAACGTSSLDFSNVQFTDSRGQPQTPVATLSGSVTVSGSTPIPTESVVAEHIYLPVLLRNARG